MIDFFVDSLREYPAIALFLTVGLGFLFGKIHYKAFTLGPVTAVLIVGVIVGQLDIKVGGAVKSIFFMMFLFSIGYSVGPQFFRALRGSGLKQVYFALIMSCMCALSALGLSWLMGYNAGEAVGTFSGSQTCSALLGIGSETIENQPIAEATKQAWINIIPVCYAVTYVFGTLGTVIILGSLGPWLLGGLKKVREQTAELARSIDGAGTADDPAASCASDCVDYRAYRLENEEFSDGIKVAALETWLNADGRRVFVGRVRTVDGNILNPKPTHVLYMGDIVVIGGRKEYLVNEDVNVGPEVDDPELLSYPVHTIPVIISKKEVDMLTVKELRALPHMHGVIIKKLERTGVELPVLNNTKLMRGDRLSLIGPGTDVNNAAQRLGEMDRPSTVTDVMYMGLAIFVGGIIGAISFHIGKVPVSLGTSGGALIAGLVFGWLHSKHPRYGHIPKSALWLMNNLGLNVFIGVVGIEAGPSFVSGICEVGWQLLVVGAVATMLPLLFGLWMGHKWFKFPAAITLGCVAGTRTCTASLGAVQTSLLSTIPAMGYTVTYAVANVMLAVWGLVGVLLLI